MKKLEGAIAAIVDGDLSELPVILGANQSDLLHAATNLPQLQISKSALMKVLTTWRRGDSNAENIQQWASFVRRGYVSRKKNDTLLSIDIEYDKSEEDLIVEIIGRLDEIGDKIDGEVDENEQDEMIRALNACLTF